MNKMAAIYIPYSKFRLDSYNQLWTTAKYMELDDVISYQHKRFLKKLVIN
jgi:hypothetical protein